MVAVFDPMDQRENESLSQCSQEFLDHIHQAIDDLLNLPPESNIEYDDLLLAIIA